MEKAINLTEQIDNCKCTYEYNKGALLKDFNTVVLGSYPQNDILGKKKEPIEWYVLEKRKEKGKALLISKYILDCKEYQGKRCSSNSQKDESEYLWWGNTSLRSFLNNEFYNLAFSKKEKENIMKIEITYRQDRINTYDNVTCLSLSELDKYFDLWREDERIKENRVACKPTPYAVSKGLHVNESSGCSGYHYRLPLECFDIDGFQIWLYRFYNVGLECYEYYAHMFDGVRPVICVKY